MGGFFDALIGWSIHNRVVVLLVAAALAIGGIYATLHASLDVLPDFTPPRVVVQTEAPAMGTLDVEQLVTRPLEQVLLGTPQATTVRSTSAPGLSVITLMFEDAVDIYRARQVVTERLQLVQGHLPEGVPPPQLAPILAPISAILKVCLTSSDSDPARAARDLRTFADWTIRPRLMSVPGVAQVVPHGGDVERIEVRPDPLRMRQRKVTMTEITDAVRSSQSVAGVGFADVGASRVDIHSEARLTVADAERQLAETVVGAGDALSVRLGEVATVVRAPEPPMGAALYDGRPAVYVQVSKLPWADTLTVTRDVERALEGLKATLPAGARLEDPISRQASFVETSVRSVSRAMAIGSVLVVFVLIAFLRSGRLAVISLTAIPLSLVAAMAVLIATGASINGMTLGGLAIAVGEVVDDAIVDVENVWRRLRENARRPDPLPALDVVRAASREIRSSVVYATVIVGLVFVPVLLLGGIAGRIFSPLAQAYVLAITASLGVALTVTPALCAWLLPSLATREEHTTRFAQWFVARYRRLLRRTVAQPRLVFALTVAIAVAAFVAVPFIGGRFLPEFRESSLIAHVFTVPGTSLEETVRIAGRIDTQLRPTPALHVASRAGRAELDEDAAPVNRLEIDLLLPDEGDWEQLANEAESRISRIPGLAVAVEGFFSERVHEVLSGETAPVVVKAIGPDIERLRGLAGEVRRIAATTAGLGGAQMEPQIDVPQIRIRPNPTELAKYGVRPLELTDGIIAWRQGRTWTQVLGRDGRVLDVAVAGPPAARQRTALLDLPVDTRLSGTVNLGSLATVDQVPVPSVIYHENGQRRISIGIDAPGSGLSRAVGTLERRLSSEVKLPQGYRLDVSGEAVVRREAARRLLLVGALVLLGIFVLLATAFGSLRDATVTLINFPLGLIGGVAGALLAPEGLSVAGLVGFVTLFGIISRNGIMLVSHKRQLDEEDPQADPIARILRASEERLLPIVMTAATAGLGLLPLALSIEAAGSELEAPMALIVCMGLITSTALNMLVLPTLYVWFARRDGDGGHVRGAANA
jgi:CzcA family heavy metal efflux pump